MRKLLVLSAVALLMAGCANSPKPAKSEIEGGESRLISERLERRPIESYFKITAETAPTPPPPPAPTYIIRITPDAKPKE